MRRRILLPLVGLAAVMAALPVSGARAATAAPATVVIAQSDTTVTLPLLSYFQMAVDSVHRHLFFSQGCSCENSILVTSFTGATVATITGQTGVAGIALSPDGSTLYAALTGPDEVTAINTATLKQVAAYHLPADWTPLSVAVQSGKVWVSYQNAKTLLPAIGYFDPSAAKPVLTTPAAMDDSNTLFDTPPLIAADPTGTGNEVVAVEPGGSFTPTASFDTAGNAVTVRAQSGRLFYGNIPDDCMNAEDVAVVPGGAQFLAACGLPYAQYRYSTADLSEQGYYPTSEYPDAVTVASATGTVAARRRARSLGCCLTGSSSWCPATTSRPSAPPSSQPRFSSSSDNPYRQAHRVSRELHLLTGLCIVAGPAPGHRVDAVLQPPKPELRPERAIEHVEVEAGA